jgi:hypothetical protein
MPLLRSFFILGMAGYKDAAPTALRNGADAKRSRKNSSRICKPASGVNESEKTTCPSISSQHFIWMMNESNHSA